ncbi:MAG: hypothetical protein ACI9DC_000483 [Gammaproteobacteria bacterium]|jgi:hypothetical protein
MRPLDENERSLYQCVTPKWSGFTISYLDVLVRGRYMIDKEKTAQAKAKGCFLDGLMRKFKKD